MRTAILLFYGLDVEIRPKSGGAHPRTALVQVGLMAAVQPVLEQWLLFIRFEVMTHVPLESW